MLPRLAALLATLAIPAVLALTAAGAHAAPAACDAADVPCLRTALRAAQAHARATKAAGRTTKARAALAKAQQAQWIADCVATWDDPASAATAHDVCVAEAPTLDELRADPTAAPRREGK